MALSGKVAIITGGTKGIGLSTAKKFVSLGAKVVVSYGGDAKAAESVVCELGSENVTALKADGSSIDGAKALVKTTVDKHSRIDILVLNAAVLPMQAIEHITEDSYEKTFNLNVKGPLFLTQQAVPYMQPGGRVIFVSTTQNFASTVQGPYLLYCATKGAIDQITRLLAKDLAKKGINVNCVAPGPTGTDLFYEGKSDAVVKQIAGLNPFQRIGNPDEVAAVFAFLAGPESGWVNGQIMKVNGGQFVG